MASILLEQRTFAIANDTLFKFLGIIIKDLENIHLFACPYQILSCPYCSISFNLRITNDDDDGDDDDDELFFVEWLTKERT